MTNQLDYLKKDIERMKIILGAYEIFPEEEIIERAWRNHSQKLFANWLNLPEGDLILLQILIDELHSINFEDYFEKKLDDLIQLGLECDMKISKVSLKSAIEKSDYIRYFTNIKEENPISKEDSLKLLSELPYTTYVDSKDTKNESVNGLTLLEKCRVFHNRFLSLYNLTYLNSNGKCKNYYVTSRQDLLKGNDIKLENNAVTSLVVNEDKSKVLLLKEFRLSVNRYVYNTVSGLIDEGETPLEALVRELKEETGYDLVKVLKEYKPSFSSVGISTELVQPFIIMVDDTQTNLEVNAGDNEDIIPVWLNKEEAQRLLDEEYLGARTQLFLDNFINGKL